MKLTERQFGTPDLNSLIHIVNTGETSPQSPNGTSYKTPLGDLTGLFGDSGQTLSQTLTIGNIVSSGQTINGFYGSQIDFEYNNQSAIGLTTDNGAYGESFLFIEKGSVEAITPAGGFLSYSTDSYTSNTGVTWMYNKKEILDGTQFAVLLSTQRDRDLLTLSQNTYGLYVFNNTELNQTTGGFVGDSAATFLSTESSTINSGVTGSVIIGGQNIIASMSNTVYVPDFVIKKSAAEPATSGSTVGEVGSITWDNTHLYVKTATGWGRILLDYGF